MSFTTRVFSISVLLAISVVICGCGAGVVNTAVDLVKGADLDPVQGVVYGGHAPIVGAEVFVLQPGVTGYYSKAVDITTNSSLPMDSTFGYRYITTTQGGYFNLNGNYACTPNYPVFLAAYGGNPNTVPPVAITGEAISGTGPYTVKFTNSGYGVLYQGETVTISGLTGSWAYLNGNQTVIGDTNLTTTTFDVSVAGNGGNATGTYTVAGSLLQASTSTAINPAIVNLAVVGICPASGATNFGSTSTTPITFIYMNEVSTVAAGYALAGFQSGQWYNVGIPAPSGNTLAFQGIQNAARTAGNLFDITGSNLGTSPAGPDFHVARSSTANGNGTVPQLLLDTLGNILANCVDSANSSGAASTQCSKLFGYATSTGSTGGMVPTDIATAIFNIAHNPGANVPNLYILPTGNVPFQPQMSSQPNDFTVGISYTGGGLNGPFYEAVDASGNIWITNQGSQAGLTISKFSPLGVSLSGTTGFTGVTDPYGIAIDTSGNVWVANYLTVGSVSEFNSSGTHLNTFTGQGMNDPYQLAFDKNGNLWVPNYGEPGGITTASISEFSSTGTGINQYLGGSMSRPRMLAISGSTIYIANQAAGAPVSDFTLSSNTFGTAFTGGGVNISCGVALDSTGNVWVANAGSNALSEFSAAGVALSGTTGYTGGGLNGPNYLAIDGTNKVFASNGSANSISAFTNAGAAITGANGYTAPTSSNGTPLNNPQDIVLDGSGNAWVVNFNSSTLVEFVGIAAPVVTPIVQALIQNKYGQKP